MLRINKNTTGFTLIELLVVVLVIGALSGVLLSVINSGGIRAKARDSQRKSELKKIQIALGLYFADNRTFPVSNPGGAPGTWEQVGRAGSALAGILSPNYIDPIPRDPTLETGADNNPSTTATFNRYNYLSTGPTYMLTAIMEIPTSINDSPCGSTIGFGAAYATVTLCYLVQNP